MAAGPKHECGRELELITEHGMLIEICVPCRFRRTVPRILPVADEHPRNAPTTERGPRPRGPYNDAPVTRSEKK